MRKKPSLTDFLLFTLEKTVEGGELILQSSQDLKDWMYEVYSAYPRPVEKYTLAQAIKRLRQRRLIEQEEKETGKIVLRLTEEGKDLILIKKDEKDLKWDGRWRIVIFDIPESKRIIRDILRKRLKNWGFQRLQKSVWISKKNLTSKLRKLIEDLGISDWVLVLESDNIYSS